MTKQQKLVIALKLLLSLLVLSAFNVSYLNTLTFKKKNVLHALPLKSIIFNPRPVCFALTKNRFSMDKDVLNVVQIKDTTVQISSAKIAIMVESTTRLQSYVSAKIHFSSTMETDVLNVSIQNTLTIHKSYVNSVPKIKSIISSSRNVYNVPQTIHSLMAIDAQSAPKILFGIKLAKNVKLAKEDKYL